MTLPRLLLAGFLVAAAAVGCGGAEPRDAATAGARGKFAAAQRSRVEPPLCRPVRARVTGRVRATAATELSGLVVSRSQRGVLWSHNDSGDRPRLLAFAPSGRPLADVALSGAQHVDWEDIATGPLRDGGTALYVGDIGDNAEERPAVVVYRVREPRVARAPGAAAVSRRFELRYPDRARDAEALLVDPATGALVIVTKDLGGLAQVYVADRRSRAGMTAMRRAGRLSLGPGEAVTGGDVAADGRTVVLRTYGGAFVWSRGRGQSLAAALRLRPCATHTGLLVERQGEALALTRDGSAFFTVSEGPRPLLRRHAPAR